MCPLAEPSLYCFFVINWIAPETSHGFVLVKTDPFKNIPPLACSVSAHKSLKKAKVVWMTYKGQHASSLTHSLQLMQLTALTDHSL